MNSDERLSYNLGALLGVVGAEMVEGASSEREAVARKLFGDVTEATSEYLSYGYTDKVDSLLSTVYDKASDQINGAFDVDTVGFIEEEVLPWVVDAQKQIKEMRKTQ